MQLIHEVTSYPNDDKLQEQLASFTLSPVIRLVQQDGTSLVASDIRRDESYSMADELNILRQFYSAAHVARLNVTYAISGDYMALSPRDRDGRSLLYGYDIEPGFDDRSGFDPFGASPNRIALELSSTGGWEEYNDFSHAFHHAHWLVSLVRKNETFVVTSKNNKQATVCINEDVAFEMIDERIERGDAMNHLKVTRVRYNETTNTVTHEVVTTQTKRHFVAIKPKLK